MIVPIASGFSMHQAHLVCAERRTELVDEADVVDAAAVEPADAVRGVLVGRGVEVVESATRVVDDLLALREALVLRERDDVARYVRRAEANVEDYLGELAGR